MGYTEMDPKTEELMWLEIDGTISPSDRESLYAHMESHPDAREHFEALRRMVLLFGQVGEIDPPSELRGRILRALESATPPAAERAGLLDRLDAFFSPRPAWRFAAVATVAATGILIGAAGYHLLRGGPGEGPGLRGGVDVSRFYGTVNVNGAGRQGSTLHIDVPGVKATVSVGRVESKVLSHLDVTSEREIEVVIAYGGPPMGFAGGELSGHPSNRIAIQDGEVRVRHQGSGEYRFVFGLDEAPASPVTVSVLSEGKVLYEEHVAPPRDAGKR